jgi:hypothetical protein
MQAFSTGEESPAPSSAPHTVRGFYLSDYLLCGVYFLLTLCVSARSAFRRNKKPEKKEPKKHESMFESTEDSKLSLRGDGVTHPATERLLSNDLLHDASKIQVRNGHDDAEDYFFAGRRANKLMVAVSLLSGLTSGITFVGVPAYVYSKGAGVFVICLSQPIGGTLTSCSFCSTRRN